MLSQDAKPSSEITLKAPLRCTTDVITIDALNLFEKVVFCEVFLSSRRKYRGTGMFKTVSKPLAHLNFLSGYDIGSSQ